MGIAIDADTVLLGGNIITMDSSRPKAKAVAIKDGRFLWVGTDEEAKAAIGKGTRVRDVEGMTILPGFIESHNHTLQFGLEQSGIDLTEAHSIDDILNLVKAQADHQEEGSWIVGSGYNQNELTEKRHPTRWDVDKVAPNHLVSLKHTSGHAMVSNSKALSLAGIGKKPQNPDGGRIDKDDKTGEPTGIFFEFSAMQYIKDIMPKPTYDDMVDGLKKANKILLSEGITSAMDAGVGWVEAPRQIAAYQEAVERGFLNIRHTLAIWSDSLLDYQNVDEELKEIEWKLLGMGIRTGLGNEKLKVGPFKFVPDGAISTGTAATYEPYGEDPENQSKGELMIDPESLMKVASAVYRFGWQLAIHGIGERALDAAIGTIEKIQRDTPRKNPRTRIEHCALVTPEMIKRIKQLDILVVLQPAFLWQLGDNWINQLGVERARKAKPFKTLLANDIIMAFSSDRPVVDGAPLLGMHSAVNEKTMNGQDYAPEERISIEDALRCYTVNGAYASFEEHIKGTIENGKLADLVILAEDPTKVSTDTIKDIKVIATMVDGEFVYEA